MESKYKVVLSSVNSKVSALKALVMVPGITEGEAMDILKSLPATVKENLTENEAELIKGIILESGCVAEVQGSYEKSSDEGEIQNKEHFGYNIAPHDTDAEIEAQKQEIIQACRSMWKTRAITCLVLGIILLVISPIVGAGLLVAAGVCMIKMNSDLKKLENNEL